MIFRTKRATAASFVVVAAWLWTIPGYTQTRRGGGETGGDMPADATGGVALPLLLRGANLTPEQKAQVKQIMANHRAILQDLFSQLRTAQDDIANKLFSTARLQESDLAPEVRQISHLRNQLADEGIRVVLEIRNVLTPEQLAKASELKAQMQSLHRQMRRLWSPEPPDR
ncbi:MAG: Spy/CpxP family protein refolding chaperone [Candidatus Binatia bacterium]